MTPEIKQKIEDAIKTKDVCLFMKGTPDAPQCGFSAQVVHVLNEHGAQFNSVDVLADWDIREGIKEFSSWPTIPQLYVKGKFVGRCDITMELHRKGELATVLKS